MSDFLLLAIKPGSGADPWMIQIGDAYYLTYTTGGDVQISKAANIAGPWPASGTSVFTPPSNLKEVWAPELHQINGTWCVWMRESKTDGAVQARSTSTLRWTMGTTTITGCTSSRVRARQTRRSPSTYVCGRPDVVTLLHMYCFQLVGKISSPDNNWAIDGTVLQVCWYLSLVCLFCALTLVALAQYQNGQLYFIWSGWSDGSHTNTQNLYIAHMSSPTAIDSNRVLIHEPKPSWQQSMLGSNRMGVNEGPATFVNEGRTFLIYCEWPASSTLTRC
jgi:GH43 family beta-xylosidase